MGADRRTLLVLLVTGAFALGGGGGHAAEAERLVPIPIRLPLPCFSRPGALKGARNLERPSAKPRPPFLAPVGTANVALGKPVISSNKQLFAEDLAPLTDGVKRVRKGTVLDIGPGRQWVQVDLGASHRIYAVVVWHDYGLFSVYFDVAVQVADDRDCIHNARVLFNGDYDNTLGLGVGQDKEYVESYEGKLIDAKGVTARYVRLHSNGSTRNDRNCYLEVEVYGKPAP